MSAGKNTSENSRAGDGGLNKFRPNDGATGRTSYEQVLATQNEEVAYAYAQQQELNKPSNERTRSLYWEVREKLVENGDISPERSKDSLFREVSDIYQDELSHGVHYISHGGDPNRDTQNAAEMSPEELTKAAAYYSLKYREVVTDPEESEFLEVLEPSAYVEQLRRYDRASEIIEKVNVATSVAHESVNEHEQLLESGAEKSEIRESVRKVSEKLIDGYIEAESYGLRYRDVGTGVVSTISKIMSLVDAKDIKKKELVEIVTGVVEKMGNGSFHTADVACEVGVAPGSIHDPLEAYRDNTISDSAVRERSAMESYVKDAPREIKKSLADYSAAMIDNANAYKDGSQTLEATVDNALSNVGVRGKLPGVENYGLRTLVHQTFIQNSERFADISDPEVAKKEASRMLNARDLEYRKELGRGYGDVLAISSLMISRGKDELAAKGQDVLGYVGEALETAKHLLIIDQFNKAQPEYVAAAQNAYADAKSTNFEENPQDVSTNYYKFGGRYLDRQTRGVPSSNSKPAIGGQDSIGFGRSLPHNLVGAELPWWWPTKPLESHLPSGRTSASKYKQQTLIAEGGLTRWVIEKGVHTVFLEKLTEDSFNPFNWFPAQVNLMPMHGNLSSLGEHNPVVNWGVAGGIVGLRAATELPAPEDVITLNPTVRDGIVKQIEDDNGNPKIIVRTGKKGGWVEMDSIYYQPEIADPKHPIPREKANEDILRKFSKGKQVKIKAGESGVDTWLIVDPEIAATHVKVTKDGKFMVKVPPYKEFDDCRKIRNKKGWVEVTPETVSGWNINYETYPASTRNKFIKVRPEIQEVTRQDNEGNEVKEKVAKLQVVNADMISAYDVNENLSLFEWILAKAGQRDFTRVEKTGMDDLKKKAAIEAVTQFDPKTEWEIKKIRKGRNYDSVGRMYFYYSDGTGKPFDLNPAEPINSDSKPSPYMISATGINAKIVFPDTGGRSKTGQKKVPTILSSHGGYMLPLNIKFEDVLEDDGRGRMVPSGRYRVIAPPESSELQWGFNVEVKNDNLEFRLGDIDESITVIDENGKAIQIPVRSYSINKPQAAERGIQNEETVPGGKFNALLPWLVLPMALVGKNTSNFIESRDMGPMAYSVKKLNQQKFQWNVDTELGHDAVFGPEPYRIAKMALISAVKIGAPWGYLATYGGTKVLYGKSPEQMLNYLNPWWTKKSEAIDVGLLWKDSIVGKWFDKNKYSREVFTTKSVAGTALVVGTLAALLAMSGLNEKAGKSVEDFGQAVGGAIHSNAITTVAYEWLTNFVDITPTSANNVNTKPNTGGVTGGSAGETTENAITDLSKVDKNSPAYKAAGKVNQDDLKTEYAYLQSLDDVNATKAALKDFFSIKVVGNENDMELLAKAFKLYKESQQANSVKIVAGGLYLTVKGPSSGDAKIDNYIRNIIGGTASPDEIRAVKNWFNS